MTEGANVPEKQLHLTHVHVDAETMDGSREVHLLNPLLEVLGHAKVLISCHLLQVQGFDNLFNHSWISCVSKPRRSLQVSLGSLCCKATRSKSLRHRWVDDWVVHIRMLVSLDLTWKLVDSLAVIVPFETAAHSYFE